MNVSIAENGRTVELTKVFNPIKLVSDSGEVIILQMRDSGFEFQYEGNWYNAKEGQIYPFHKSVRGNTLVDQTVQDHVDVCIAN